jgi:protein tyrosine/serine phosphatase
MKKIGAWLLLAVILGSATFLISAESTTPAPAAAKAERNPEWAAPVPLAGVPNLHKVADGVYRSAQPTAEGFKNLEKLGIKTVINLRALHDDAGETKGTKLRRVDVPVNTWHIEEADVIRVMTLLAQKENGPFLIHCQHGADRTGLMCAMYRILVQGWTKDKALDEMTNGGYGYHTVWANIITYIQKADVAKLKAATAPPPAVAPAP